MDANLEQALTRMGTQIKDLQDRLAVLENNPPLPVVENIEYSEPDITTTTGIVGHTSNIDDAVVSFGDMGSEIKLSIRSEKSRADYWEGEATRLAVENTNLNSIIKNLREKKLLVWKASEDLVDSLATISDKIRQSHTAMADAEEAALLASPKIELDTPAFHKPALLDSNEVDIFECELCGAPCDAVGRPGPCIPENKPPSVKKSGEDFKICPRCESEQPAGTKTCLNCGECFDSG